MARPGHEPRRHLLQPGIDGGAEDSKDGKRDEIWPIIGGRFEGPNIRGTVVPDGGDFPVVRPDGVAIQIYRVG